MVYLQLASNCKGDPSNGTPVRCSRHDQGARGNRRRTSEGLLLKTLNGSISAIVLLETTKLNQLSRVRYGLMINISLPR
jgi:hypothetical protein